MLLLCACGRSTLQPAQLPPLDSMKEAAAASDMANYRLQPGDVVRVQFLNHAELNSKVLIRPDGVMTLDIGGEVHAAGLTLDALAQAIKERTSDRLRDPEVSVVIAQLGDHKVYVGGEVRLPGFVTFYPGITPLAAVMDRGGFTDTARADSVLLISAVQGAYQGTRLDLTQPLSAGIPDERPLAAGDVLYVPRTFVGDVNYFVRAYIRDVLPLNPALGAVGLF